MSSGLKMKLNNNTIVNSNKDKGDSLKLKNKVYCILKRKENNFFATVLNTNKNVVLSKSCGSLLGIRGSKKFTTVALENLGKELFLKLYGFGYITYDFELILRFKIDKFVKSFLRGLLLYGRGFIKLNLKVESLNTNNGLRASKQRRV